MSQNQTILKHLLQGKSITALEAIEQYGIMRCAARICDLRDQEYRIKTLIIEKNQKRFAKYYIENPQQPLNY